MQEAEIESVLKLMTARFTVPPKVNPVVELNEYRQAFEAFGRKEIEDAFDWLKSNRASRTWPPISAIREAIHKAGALPQHRDAKSFDEIIAERWATARKIYDEMPNPQREIAIAENFENDYRRDAVQAIFDRIRNGLEPTQLPLLGEEVDSEGRALGLFVWLRERGKAYALGKEYQTKMGMKNKSFVKTL